MSALEAAMKSCASRMESVLDGLMPASTTPEARVIEAMRYGALDGGKRIRPFLLTQSASLFGVSETRAYRAAAAIEMVHCYSLVHDDLPAMDDDDLRRGRPTVHKKFDEATAILAGDALLTKAFEVLAHSDTHDNASVRADLCLTLAKAAGDHGMVGGQMLDLVAEHSELDIPEITRLQRMKTGALIAASCEMVGSWAKLRSTRAMRCIITPTMSVSRSRLPTIFWTSKATAMRSASGPVRTPQPAKRHLCR